MLLTKPCSALFLQVTSSFSFGMLLTNFVGGLAVIILGWTRAGIGCTLGNLTGFVFWVLMGILLTYLWDFNNMPMNIYPKLFWQIGAFIVPVFVITNWSGLAVLGQLSTVQILWGIVLWWRAFIL